MPWKFILLFNFSTNHNKALQSTLPAVLSLGEKFAAVQKFCCPVVRWYHGKSEGNLMVSTLKPCKTKRPNVFWDADIKFRVLFRLPAMTICLFFTYFGFTIQLAEFYFFANASKAAILFKTSQQTFIHSCFFRTLVFSHCLVNFSSLLFIYFSAWLW